MFVVKTTNPTHLFSVLSTYLTHISYITYNVKPCASPVVLAPLLSSGLALGRVVSTAEVWELVEHPILSCAHRGLDD